MTAQKYVVWWLLLVAIPAFAWHLFTLGPVRGNIFRLAVPDAVYLTNLREPQLACRSLSLRRPRILVIGDSHSYASWDFAQLERGLNERIGACALGGLYLESVPLLLDYALASAPDGSLVILGLSPRMLWDLPAKDEQIQHHRQSIPSMKTNAAPFLKRALLGHALPYDREAAAIARHAGRIEALDEAEIEARLLESQRSMRTLMDWSRRIEEARHARGVQSSARAICDRIRKHKLQLWVLHIPESPHLESRYSQRIWNDYRDSLELLSPCADRLIIERAVSYGLGNRHYVNRQLGDNHDYGMWSRPGPLTDGFAFDADHLNPVGASHFTRALLLKLGARQ